MNDDEFKRHLSQLQTPAVSDTVRERARFRSTLALNRAEVAPGGDDWAC